MKPRFFIAKIFKKKFAKMLDYTHCKVYHITVGRG